MKGDSALDKTEERFVAYASQLTYADLTPQANHAVKRSVIDSIGCAFGAFDVASTRAIRNLAAQVTSTRPATVIGTRIRSSPELAAFANSSMIRYLDFSDDYFGGYGEMGPHPSDNIGAVLAAAESAGAGGADVLLGVAIAYEAVGQIIDKLDLGGVKPSWDYPIFHSIASSLGGGKVLGLSRPQLRDALALAIIPNISLSQTRLGELSNWKGFRGPNGARNGLFAAMLAREGITGPEDAFEGKAGLMNHLQQHFELGTLGGDGTPFKIEGTYFKFMPVRYNVQLSVWIALELRKKIRLEEVESICVFREKRSVIAGADNPEYWNPMTRETADHSMPYLVGAAFVDGDINSTTFTPERFRDPVILALTRKIRMQEDPAFTAAYPKTFHCRFEVTMKSGEVVTMEQTNPRGHPKNPMTDHEIEEKFLKQATVACIPEAQSRSLLAQLWRLEQVTELGTLFEMMRVPSKVGDAGN